MNIARQRLSAAADERDDSEDSEEVVPVRPALEERLVQGALAKIAADRRRRQAQRRFMQRVAMVGSMLSAACLLLFLWPRTPPSMVMELGYDQQHLGAVAAASPGPSRPPEAPPPPRLRPDSVLTVTLRPRDARQGAVKVLSFLRSGGVLRPWAVAPRPIQSGSGTLRLRAPINELPELATLPPGPCEIVLAVGSRGAGPSAAQVERALPSLDREGRGAVSGWQLHRRVIELLPR